MKKKSDVIKKYLINGNGLLLLADPRVGKSKAIADILNENENAIAVVCQSYDEVTPYLKNPFKTKQVYTDVDLRDYNLRNFLKDRDIYVDDFYFNEYDGPFKGSVCQTRKDSRVKSEKVI